MNGHFKVGHYKSLERKKEDEKHVEESKETDEEKEHKDENEDDIMQLAQGPKKESGTIDEKDETRRRLCDLRRISCHGRNHSHTSCEYSLIIFLWFKIFN